MSLETGYFGFLNMDCIAQQSLCINDLGLERRKDESYCYDNSARDYNGYLFQYTLDGCGIYESGGIQRSLVKGTAFFITFPEESRYYYSSAYTGENPWSFFYLHFSGPAAKPFFERIRELTGPVMELETDSLPVSLFFELYQTLNSGQPLIRYAGSEWLYRFLASLLRYIECPSARNTSTHISAAIEWMKNNFARQLNLAEMSQAIGVTYSHLNRQFYKEQGITPVQFLTHMRLEHGMQLLVNTDFSIEKIAGECGFSCANYFTKVFKRVLHTTPAQYRSQHKLPVLY